MLPRPKNFDHRIVAHMEGRSQKKWKTLRKIASPQPESESEAKDVRDIAVEEKEVESPLLPDVTPEGPVRILAAIISAFFLWHADWRARGTFVV